MATTPPMTTPSATWPTAIGSGGVDAPGHPVGRPPVNHTPGRLAIILTGISTLASVVYALRHAGYAGIVEDLAAGRLSLADATSWENGLAMIAIVELAFLLLGGIALLTWLHGAHGRATAYGIGGRIRAGRGWTIGAWFVPILNLFRPAQLVHDVRRSAMGDLATGALPGTVPIVGLWWGTWLVTNIGTWYATTTSTMAFESVTIEGMVAELNMASAAHVVVAALTVASWLLLRQIIVGTDSDQQAQWDALTSSPASGAPLRD